MDSGGYFIRSWRNPMDCIIVVGFRPQKGTTMNIVWKAELSREMMSHLSDEQQHMLMRRLTEVVDKTAAEFMVGREFKNGLRTTP